MDIEKLKAFIVVAEELNFRKSAEILGVSQPPLTRRISSLEEELSTKLFERTTREVKLTGAGVYLLREAREIVAKIEGVASEVRAIGRMKYGGLRIGFSTTAVLARFPKIIESFQDRFPKLKIELRHASGEELVKSLRANRFDLIFSESQARRPDLKSFVVRDETLGILAPRKHPLATKKEIEFLELRNETFILHPKKDRPEFYRVVRRLFAQNKIPPKIYIKKADELCPALVALGVGVALTIGDSHESASSDIRFVPVKNLFLPVSVFWSPTNENPQLKSFLSFVFENSALGAQAAECLMDICKLPQRTSRSA
jgi:DNA-binding transcriptional LysR family regulator